MESNPNPQMEFPFPQGQVSRRHLQSEETVVTFPGISRVRTCVAKLTIAGRSWTIAASPRGGGISVMLGVMDLTFNEIGVAQVKLLDHRQIPPVAWKPTYAIVYPGQAGMFSLPPLAELVKDGVITNDSLEITVGAAIINPPKNPSSSLSKDFGRIMESGDGCDVTFRVAGQDFLAHRTVIQARSSALAALIPDVAESPIEIGGTEPKAFGSFLKYLYTAELPRAEEILGEAYTKEGGCHIRESLFHVADRFNHEDLKGILETRMIAQLDPSTAARTVAFAEQYGRRMLQSKCCHLVVAKGWLQEVLQSESFGQLKEGMGNSYPTVAKDALLLEASRALKRPRVTESVPNAGA